MVLVWSGKHNVSYRFCHGLIEHGKQDQTRIHEPYLDREIFYVELKTLVEEDTNMLSHVAFNDKKMEIRTQGYNYT